MLLSFNKRLWIILSNQNRVFWKDVVAELFKCIIDIRLQYDIVKADV